MLTTSKKWAAVTGFAIVAAAVAAGISRPPASAVTRPVPEPVGAAPPRPLAPGRDPASGTRTTPAAPRFDVVRVDPSGEAVVAGTATPQALVALLGKGAVLAEARADSGGRFVMLPPPLKAGDQALTLRQSADGAAPVASAQSVAVSVPEHGGPVAVALVEPGSPTRLLSAPPAAGREQSLVVHSVELENGSGFYAAGAAAPATKLHLYLNDAHLADVVAAADGQWSLKIRQGLTGGHYVVRADGSRDGRTVIARAEVPFDVPPAMAAAPRRPRGRTAPARSPAVPILPPQAATPGRDGEREAAVALSQAVVAEVGTAAVRGGDNLWDISRARLGEGRRYTRIYAANAAQIRDPRLIYPGQVFVLPTPGD